MDYTFISRWNKNVIVVNDRLQVTEHEGHKFLNPTIFRYYRKYASKEKRNHIMKPQLYLSSVKVCGLHRRFIRNLSACLHRIAGIQIWNYLGKDLRYLCDI